MSMSRKESTFASGQDACAAWFYPAAADQGARPVIVMARGLTGTRRDCLGAFAERFAAAGIAALVFDYRGFGDSTGEPDLGGIGAATHLRVRRSLFRQSYLSENVAVASAIRRLN